MTASTAAARIALRPVTDADREFLVECYGATRAEELAQVQWSEAERDAFIRMQFEAQDTHYRQHYDDITFDVVEVEGRAAGRLYVDRRVDDIRIVDVSLLPEFRGAGIGSALIEGILLEASGSGRTASIHVEMFNRARTLYDRLGFREIAEHGVYRLLEWAAP